MKTFKIHLCSIGVTKGTADTWGLQNGTQAQYWSSASEKHSHPLCPGQSFHSFHLQLYGFVNMPFPQEKSTFPSIITTITENNNTGYPKLQYINAQSCDLKSTAGMMCFRRLTWKLPRLPWQKLQGILFNWILDYCKNMVFGRQKFMKAFGA